MQKKTDRSQLMMRGRVAAQAFTIGAMAFSLFFASPLAKGRSKAAANKEAKEVEAAKWRLLCRKLPLPMYYEERILSDVIFV